MDKSNGVEGRFGYNSRHQVESLHYYKGSTDLLKLDYGYTSANNGQIRSVTDQLDASRAMSYDYDDLGRLVEATAGNPSSPTWKLGFVYDRHGNRWQQNVLAGSAPGPQVSFDYATNRINSSGYAYDNAGNMTNDTINTYTWDGENRMKQVNPGGSGASYTYFGALRVKKVVGSTTTRYIFSGSQVLAEYENGAATNSPAREYVYAGATLVATLNSGTPTYHHRDHLSTRVETNTSGTAVRTLGQFPFGEVWYETGTATKWKFTSYERDAKSPHKLVSLVWGFGAVREQIARLLLRVSVVRPGPKNRLTDFHLSDNLYCMLYPRDITEEKMTRNSCVIKILPLSSLTSRFCGEAMP